MRLNLKYANAVFRITLCQFGIGLCGEQTHLAHFILAQVSLGRGLSLQSKLITLYSPNNQNTHAFLVYGQNLSGITEQFSSLQNLDDSVYVYDPTYKILSSAKEYVNNPYMKALCTNYEMYIITTRTEDNILCKMDKEIIEVIQKGVQILLKQSQIGIIASLTENKGDPKVLKILKDLQREVSSRCSILDIITRIETASIVSYPSPTKISYPTYYLFHVKQSNHNAQKWNECRKAELTERFEYEPKRIDSMNNP